MKLYYNTIIAAIKRHLSIIGKRFYSKDGKNLFSDITLSSAEEREILIQYINSSAQNIEAILKQFITSSTYTTTGENPNIEMVIANTRGDADFETRAQSMAESFVTINSVAEYLSMVHPDIAQKYQKDALQNIESLVAYVFYKKSPISLTAITNPTGSVS